MLRCQSDLTLPTDFVHNSASHQLKRSSVERVSWGELGCSGATVCCLVYFVGRLTSTSNRSCAIPDVVIPTALHHKLTQ